jgi:hypothetical protein
MYTKITSVKSLKGMIKSNILPNEAVVITGFNINNVLQNQSKRKTPYALYLQPYCYQNHNTRIKRVTIGSEADPLRAPPRNFLL